MVDKIKYNSVRKINEYNIYLILVLDGAYFFFPSHSVANSKQNRYIDLLELVHAFAGLGHKLPKGTLKIILLVLCQGVSVSLSVQTLSSICHI